MADLEIIEHHPQRVLEAFRRGEFDQLEIIGEADEKEFFELCFREKILPVLAETNSDFVDRAGQRLSRLLGNRTTLAERMGALRPARLCAPWATDEHNRAEPTAFS